MRVRYIQTENTPHRFVEAGTVCDVTDEKALELFEQGLAEPAPAESERAVKPKAKTAVKK